MIQWDPARKILTDNMGYPISLTEAKELMEQARQHLQKTPAQLAAIAESIFAPKHTLRDSSEFSEADFK